MHALAVVGVRGKKKKELQVHWSDGSKQWHTFQEVDDDWHDLVVGFMEKKKKEEEEFSKTQTCQVDHLCDFTPGTHWGTESDSRYCALGGELNTNCILCSVPFVPTGESIPKVRFRPTTKHPAHTCINRCKLGCRKAICDTCMMEKRSTATPTGASTRTRCSTRS